MIRKRRSLLWNIGTGIWFVLAGSITVVATIFMTLISILIAAAPLVIAAMVAIFVLASMGVI